MVIMGSSVPGRVSRCRPAWRKCMPRTIRFVSTIIFISLSETNTIGYIPIIERMRSGLNKTGLLFVGDCKMSALETRAYLARHQDWYLSPLPLTGATAEAMDAWITAGVTQGEAGK